MGEQSLEDSATERDVQEKLESLSALERERPLAAAELVEKGRSIQLASHPSLGLSDAEDSFKRALEIDPDYVPALIELGYFYSAVKDDVASALAWFEKAIAVSRAQLTEAAIGGSQCLAELSSEPVAANFLRDLHRQALVTEEMDPEKLRWLIASDDM
jgi:tetratricopeptide (TPR) repeat protein